MFQQLQKWINKHYNSELNKNNKIEFELRVIKFKMHDQGINEIT